jgi:putative oxidoreductase
MSAIAAFLGRLMLALLFVLSGIGKIIDPSGTAQMMQGAGLPGNLALAVGIFEVVAGLLLALGVMTRLVSILLAAFVALTILFYHHDFATQAGMATFLTHLAIIGGLLMSFAYGHMYWGYDRMRAQRKGELAAVDANERAHDAEIRAARAEGRADALGTARPVVADVDGDGVPEVRR